MSKPNLDRDSLAGTLLAADGFHLALALAPPALRKRYRLLADAALTWFGSRGETEGNPREIRELHLTPEGMYAEELARGWNEICGVQHHLAKVMLPLSGGRLAKARCRVREHPDPEWWRDVFAAIGQSRFLRGVNGGTNKHQHWRATFDWLIANDTNAVKVIEGQYADDRGTHS